MLRPGILSFWLDGPIGYKDRIKCLEMLARDVVPALREIGKELGLVNPFQRAPGSVPLAPGRKPESVAQPDRLPPTLG